MPGSGERRRYTANQTLVTMQLNGRFETPDASLVSFNSNYEAARAMTGSTSNRTFSRSIDDVIEDMTDEIWRVCYFLVGGAPQKDEINTKLHDLFDRDVDFRITSLGPFQVEVKPPSKATKSIDHHIGDPSLFQVGYIQFQVDGNPKVRGSDQHVVSRLTALYSLMR
jgi:hypothetical protein